MWLPEQDDYCLREGTGEPGKRNLKLGLGQSESIEKRTKAKLFLFEDRRKGGVGHANCNGLKSSVPMRWKGGKGKEGSGARSRSEQGKGPSKKKKKKKTSRDSALLQKRRIKRDRVAGLRRWEGRKKGNGFRSEEGREQKNRAGGKQRKGETWEKRFSGSKKSYVC